jgi:hypothetical protein
VILYRCFAWNESARPVEPDGALWFPRVFQGEGRHDNPDAFGCLYLADRALSCTVEQFARFRGQRLTPALLRRRGLPLALAALELADDAELLDLDQPTVLRRERLRPSVVATRDRRVTQPQARRLYEAHPAAAGLRWWSAYESQWTNVTLFDRAAASLRLESIAPLTLEHPALTETAEFFALRTG